MHTHQTIWDGTNKHECNSAWTREHERVICHAVPMIEVKMNNGNIMCFPVCAAGCSKDIYSSRAVLTPSWKCKWPSFCQRISHHADAVPKLVSQKKKGEMLLFVCMFRVIRACGLLFASSRATALIADRPAATETPSPTHFTAAAAPEAGYIQLQGPLLRTPLFPQHTLSWKPRALSKLIVSELTASLQKRLNACSLIIWILVNWINCWIESVLLKMTKKKKTQGQGEQKRGINILPVRSQAFRRHGHARAHGVCSSSLGVLSSVATFASPMYLPISVSVWHTHKHKHAHVTQVKWTSASKSRKLPRRNTEIRTKPIFKAQSKCQIIFDAGRRRLLASPAFKD